jgi:hypothetical protein
VFNIPSFRGVRGVHIPSFRGVRGVHIPSHRGVRGVNLSDASISLFKTHLNPV